MGAGVFATESTSLLEGREGSSRSGEGVGQKWNGTRSGDRTRNWQNLNVRPLGGWTIGHWGRLIERVGWPPRGNWKKRVLSEEQRLIPP